MGTRVSYPIEVKQKAVEMRLAGVPMKEIMQELNIKNKTQVQTWVRWHKAGDTHRFEQPVGKQYTYYEYQKAVKTKGITKSMSRKGTPADNASIESFHSSLKSETFYLNSIDRTTTAIVERTVKEYIYYYNNIRIQTKLNSQSPISYRQLEV
ncbi:IS3 family transposase [Bacillus mojavensis]|nr:IS3 family transposase [Bacillus mojavensis]